MRVRERWENAKTFTKAELDKLVFICGVRRKAGETYAAKVAKVAAIITGLDIFDEGNRVMWRIPGHSAMIPMATLTDDDEKYIPADEYGVRIANMLL